MTSTPLKSLADVIVKENARLMKSAHNEEELRIGFEKILDPVLKSIGVIGKTRYERMEKTKESKFRGRPDAVHGQVIIEYESPGSFRSEKKTLHAKKQLYEYMEAESENDDIRRIAGVGFDGEKIFFVRYNGPSDEEIEWKYFQVQGPLDFTPETAYTLLIHLRALSRLPMTAEKLSEVFGPQSDLARNAVSAFYDAFQNWGGDRARVFFNEWKRLFGIVYGEQFDNHGAFDMTAMKRMYKIKGDAGFQDVLFSIHTYFALLMKLIAAELLTYGDTSFSETYSRSIANCSNREIKQKLSEIEDGGVFLRRGILNFLEGDFFRWHLDAFSPRLQENIKDMARALSEFEPATSTIEPESAKDLLKRLYQYLVPQQVRHHLGEYYTPDWLAELVLQEVGYTGDAKKRILDPACGSGTFLVLAVHKAKEFGEKNNILPVETAKGILNNIWGFDLNPLAVIAARTNFLFAMGELRSLVQDYEIPVYLADSVLWPERMGQMSINFSGGDSIPIQTSLEKAFHVPTVWIKNKGFFLNRAAPLIEKMARQHFDPEEALIALRKEGLVFPPHEDVVKNFYNEILQLEKQDKNGIWARFLKNVFAPLLADPFDYVVGNPPWIRWGYLSDTYRKATLPMWTEYGLFSLRGHAARLGGGEKDFSMLFTYAVIDYYLGKKGRLGFLITQEVFKAKGAGEGFRRFQLGERDFIGVLKAHDFTALQPFEGASNKTAAIILSKGDRTRYPLPYIIWSRKKGSRQPAPHHSLLQASVLLEKIKFLAQPINTPTSSWQTFSKRGANFQSLKGENPYQARLGARVEPYGIFMVEIKQVMANGDLLITNLPEKGKRIIRKVEERIEPDLVFPAIRGSDIKRWGVRQKIYILMSQDPALSQPIPENIMKMKYPKSFDYLTIFKDELLSRGSKVVRQFAERTEFYAMFGIGPYTIENYKVVWKRMANDIVAAVASQFETPFGFKTIIPTDTVSLFALKNEDEAHYLCAVLNSVIVRDFIKTFSSGGRGFGTPSVMNPLGIPVFDRKNDLHNELAQSSMILHDLFLQGKDTEIEKKEKVINKLSEALFK